jgi:hypothetical protein
MKFKISILLLISTIVIVSCYKTPEYPIEPEIKFIAYSVTQPYIVADTGILRISFTDGDGDLGKLSNSDSGTLSKIFIKELKYGLSKIPQPIPIIPQKGTTKAISGTIDIYLAGTSGVGLFDATSCLLYQHPLDTLQFEIYIQDRAGNKSNLITIPPLIIKCP